MRRAIGPLIIFGIGLGVGLLLLRNYTGGRRASDDQARRNVLAILDRSPNSAPVPDNPMVLAAAKIEPAVVNIDTAGVRSTTGVDFWGRPVEGQEDFQGKGSGVILSPDGYIVTNNHVIESASIIRVTTVKDQKYTAQLIGTDPEADLAVIKIDAAGLPPAEFGDSSSLKVGEYALAVGNPLGVGTTVTHGIISATDRKNLPVGDGRIIAQAIQTDAPINRGNSGGALANINGQLIGINTAIKSDNGGNMGIGFAIPINTVRSTIRNIIDKGKVAASDPGKPYIGIRVLPISPDSAEDLGLKPGQGVSIGVYPLTPADNAGLKSGTIVLSMDGKPIGSIEDVQAVVSKHKIGDTITLRVLRGDRSQEDVKITVGRRPSGL